MRRPRLSGLALPVALMLPIASARTMTGDAVTFTQSASGVTLTLPENRGAEPDQVIVLVPAPAR